MHSAVFSDYCFCDGVNMKSLYRAYLVNALLHHGTISHCWISGNYIHSSRFCYTIFEKRRSGLNLVCPAIKKEAIKKDKRTKASLSCWTTHPMEYKLILLVLSTRGIIYYPETSEFASSKQEACLWSRSQKTMCGQCSWGQWFHRKDKLKTS